jgi:hypothetical protein
LTRDQFSIISGHSLRKRERVSGERNSFSLKQYSTWLKRSPIWNRRNSIWSKRNPISLTRNPIWSKQNPILLTRNPIWSKQNPISRIRNPIWLKRNWIWSAATPWRAATDRCEGQHAKRCVTDRRLPQRCQVTALHRLPFSGLSTRKRFKGGRVPNFAYSPFAINDLAKPVWLFEPGNRWGL